MKGIRRFFIIIEAFYSLFLIFLEVFRFVNPYWLPCVILSTFRFYLYIPVPIFLLSALIKRKFMRHLFAFVNLAFFIFFYGSLFVPKVQCDKDTGLSVMTFNIQHGSKGADGIIKYIKGEQPSVLALQEVKSNNPVVRQLKSLGYTFNHKPYFKNTNSGMIIAVRKPFKLNRVLRKTYHEKGRWAYLFAEIILESEEALFNDQFPSRFNILMPHLLPFGLDGNILSDVKGNLQKINRRTVWQIQETKALMELVQDFKDPTIMLGDFNSTHEQQLHTEIVQHMQDAWLEKGFGYGGTRTFFLPLRIDFIYCTPHFNVCSAHRGPDLLSDHRPVSAQVLLK